MYTIKQVAEKLKVNANAIRFYEEKGLITPSRGENKYRAYTLEDISRLEMILLYRNMGFSITSIRRLLKDSQNQELLNQFSAQYNILNHHIQTMNMVRDTLGSCIEELLKENPNQENLMMQMEARADILSLSKEWEDRWHFNSWAEAYDQDIRLETKGLNFYQNYDSVLKATADMVLKGDIVEIGVGTGNLAHEILKRGIQKNTYTGIDPSLHMLRQAKKKCPDIALRIGDFLHLPLAHNSCDIIVSSYAFHHCTEEEKQLAVWEMNRILRPGSRIVLTDLMFENQESRTAFEKNCSVEEKEDLDDEYFGNVDIIENLLNDCGFTCTHRRLDSLIWMITADKTV